MVADTKQETGAAPPARPEPSSVVRADEQMMKGKTICPFLRTALKAGVLDFDGRTAPQDTLEELLGGGLNGLGRVAKFFAQRNHTSPSTPPGCYDPLNLVGSRGAHPGDSQILSARGFDPQRFAEFIAHAQPGPEGAYMTERELGAAIAENLRRDPNSRVGHLDVLFNNDMRNSAGEFGLLLEGFGKTLREGRDKGRKAVFVEDMRLLFEKNEFPVDWQRTVKAASALGWATTSFGNSGFGGIYGEARKAYAAISATRGEEGA
jgi:hypothetical protein